MLGVLISIVVIAIVSLVPSIYRHSSYGSKLEEYIVSRNPKNTYDVEKLTREYEQKQTKGIV